MSGTVHRPDEAIAVTRQRFDEMRALRVVVERCPQPLHGIVQALLEVHKGVGGPELLLQLFPGDGFTRPFQQHDKDLYRLTLQPDLHALFAEFPSSWIELENAKTEGRRN